MFRSMIRGALRYIERVWNELYPWFPLGYSFLSGDFGEPFQADENRGVVYTSFSILTMLITVITVCYHTLRPASQDPA